MATEAQIDAVVQAYAAQHDAVRNRVIAYVRTQWASLTSYGEADIERLIDQILPVVTAGLVTVASVTDAYLATVETAVTGVSTKPVGVPRAAVSHPAMRGVDARDLYRRSGQQVWWELSKGADIEQAAARGLDRLARTVEADVQLARTHSSKYVLDGKKNVVGYRRVLSGAENCPLCRIASTQRYRTDRLLPIHSNCDCRIRPIYGDRDPGRVIDPELLEQIKAEQRAKDAPKPVVHEHAEIGPQLVDGRQRVKPRSQLTAAARRKAERSAELRARWQENLAAARANGGVIEVDPKTLRPIVRAA